MTREEFFDYFRKGDHPTEAQFIELLNNLVFSLPSTENLPIASADNLGQSYEIQGNIYKSEIVSEGIYNWNNKTASSGGVTPSYSDLLNKPFINNVQLVGKRSLSDIGAFPDFKNLKLISKPIDDSFILPIGNLKNELNFAYATDIAKFISQYMSTVGTVKQSLTIEGSQDGYNLSFNTIESFYLGTSSLYLNGQRMIPGIDYDEVDEKTFQFKDEPPTPEDRLFFEAIKK